MRSKTFQESFGAQNRIPLSHRMRCERPLSPLAGVPPWRRGQARHESQQALDNLLHILELDRGAVIHGDNAVGVLGKIDTIRIH